MFKISQNYKSFNSDFKKSLNLVVIITVKNNVIANIQILIENSFSMLVGVNAIRFYHCTNSLSLNRKLN